MAIPKIEELYNPILGFFLEYDEESLDTIRKVMKEYFYMASEEAFRRGGDRKKPTLFERRVSDSCSNLFNAGLLLRPQKGTYAISDMGKKIADIYEDVDNNLLRQIIKYQNDIRKNQESSADINTSQKGMQDNGVDIRNFVRVREYKNIPEVTIDTIIKLKEQDTRFANMLATDIYMLEGGQIREVPQLVLQHNMSLTEYNETVSPHNSSDVAFVCKADVNDPAKIKAVRKKRGADTYDIGIKRPRKWEDPDPFENGFSSIEDKYNHMKSYNEKTFMEAMRQLIKIDYKISYAELNRKTGISEDKLRNMCNDPDYDPKFQDLTAIFISLKVPILVCKAIYKLAGYDPTSPKYIKYFAIIEVERYGTPSEINAYCKQAGLDELFSATATE